MPSFPIVGRQALVAVWVAVCCAALGGVRPAAAQVRGAVGEAEVVWDNVPLADALYELGERTGVELVFALRLVRDVRVSGRYRVTDDPDRALRLLLRDTGVRAERIRVGQYVLIAEPLNVRAGDVGPEAYTGTLDGSVVDAESGAALAGAHVWLVDLGLGAVVRDDGSFAVERLPTGEYVVRVSHVGYGAVRLTLSVFPDSPRLPPTIRLRPERVASAEAEVHPGPEPPGPTPGLTDLGARQAAAVPYALADGDLAAGLSWLPGLSRTGGASGALVVRGADPQALRTLRDGVPLYDPWHAGGLFSAFQPEALAAVRLHRGSLPAPLGGGLAGVMEVETTDALTGDTTRIAGLGPVAARLVVDAPIGERAGLHVGLRRSTLGLLLAPRLRGEPGALVLDPVGGRVGGGGPHVGFDDAEVKASLRVGPQRRLDASATLGHDAVRADLPLARDGFGRALDYRWRTRTASVRYRSLIGQRLFVTALAYHSGHAAREARTPVGTGPSIVPVVVRQSLDEAGASVDLDRFVTPRHTVRAGLQAAARRVDGTRDAPLDAGGDQADRQRGTEVAVYLLDAWRPSEALQIQPGLRIEAIGRDGTLADVALSPRVFARWTPEPDRLVVRAGLSRQTQAVHRLRGRAGEQYDLTASRWVLAGAAAPLASAWQGGAGAEWAPTSTLAVSLDLYLRRSTGLLEPVRAAPSEPGVVDVLGRFGPHEGLATGVEGAARWARGAWTLGLSGALSRARIRPDRGPAAAGVPPLPWQAARYDRPVSVSLLAERRGQGLTGAVRLDVESGLGRPDGTRQPVEVRASAAAGVRAAWAGLQWTASLQATVRPSGLGPARSGALDPSVPLVMDPRSLPALPLVSLTARW